MSYSKMQGFTLIELIIVIVILGILAVTVTPRFIDISSDARVASMQGLKGAIESAAELVFMKAVIQGVQNDVTAMVDIDNDSVGDIATKYGYPTYSGMADAVEIDDWHYAVGGDKFWVGFSDHNGGRKGRTNNGLGIRRGGCHLKYVPSNAIGAKPSYSVPTSC
jgi:MSHA pilin protein MshA